MAKYTNTIEYTPQSCSFEVTITTSHIYYIVGRCFKGSRHYSPNMTSLKEIDKELDKYIATVEYFGGGEIQVFCDEEIIWSFIV